MVVFSTFGSPDPAPSLETMQDRVLGQDALLNAVVEDAVTALYNRVEGQEEQLATVYKPIARDFGERVRENGGLLSTVTEDARQQLATRVSTQAGQLASAAPREATAVIVANAREHDCGWTEPPPEWIRYPAIRGGMTGWYCYRNTSSMQSVPVYYHADGWSTFNPVRSPSEAGQWVPLEGPFANSDELSVYCRPYCPPEAGVGAGDEELPEEEEIPDEDDEEVPEDDDDNGDDDCPPCPPPPCIPICKEEPPPPPPPEECPLVDAVDFQVGGELWVNCQGKAVTFHPTSLTLPEDREGLQAPVGSGSYLAAAVQRGAVGDPPSSPPWQRSQHTFQGNASGLVGWMVGVGPEALLEACCKPIVGGEEAEILPLPPGRDVCLVDPGSPVICVQMDSMMTAFSAVGRGFVDLLTGKVNADLLGNGGLTELLKGVPLVGEGLAKLVSFGPLQNILDALASARNLLVSTLPEKAALLLGLYGTRAILRLFEESSVGWELGPQLLLSLRIELPQMRTLVDYAIQYACPVQSPSMSDIETAVLADNIEPRHAECLAAMQGYTRSVLDGNVFSRRSRPTEDVLIRDWLRLRRPVGELFSDMRRMGWMDRGEASTLLRSYDYVPPPSDLIRFAIRDVFDPNKLGKREMLEELAQQQGMLELMRAQGIGQLQVRTPDGQDRMYDVPSLYWLASFQEISPTQSYEMLHRLRPGRVQKLSLPGPDGGRVIPGIMTIADVRKLLKEVDYNPIWRDRLAAISYRVITRVDARRIYRVGGFGKPLGARGFDTSLPGRPRPVGQAEVELGEVYQDMGYTPQDANILAHFSAVEADRLENGAEQKRIGKQVCAAYQAGVFSQVQAIDRLVQSGLSRDAATRAVALCDSDRRLRDVTTATKVTRGLYLRGAVDVATARALLVNVGMELGRITELLRLWSVEQLGRRKEVTASQMCGWFQQGLITIGEMSTRLVRIGYTPDDAVRITRHCQLGHLAKEAKERDAKLKAQLREQERLEKLAAQRARAAAGRRNGTAGGTGVN